MVKLRRYKKIMKDMKMRNFSVEIIGTNFDTGETMYICRVGCESFIFTKPELKRFLDMYVEDSDKTEREFYQRVGSIEPYIPPDCPLPDEPEKMKGKIGVKNYARLHDWQIDMGDVKVISKKWFDTKEEARQDALEWAGKLGVEVEG